jgi:CRP-like cAMP-binding protein
MTCSRVARESSRLGLQGWEGLQAFLGHTRIRGRIGRGEDIVGLGSSPKHLTVLLEGITCSYTRLEDGRRQIYGFQYSGDFCDLHRYVLAEADGAIAVSALTDCSIGTIDFEDIDRAMERYPDLSLALWRVAMREASIARVRLLHVSRRPALQRVAHLLCEQLARLRAIGIDSNVVPLTQIDLADAAGLSTVHLSRTFSSLRRLGVLAEDSRAIEVVNRERLVQLAEFNSHYLGVPVALAHWEVSTGGRDA